MQREDIKNVLGCEDEGAEGGKVVERAEEGYLRIKKEPGVELDRVVVSAVVPCDDPAVLQYTIVEDEQVSDCFTIGSNDSDVEEVNKVEVKEVLKNLANLRRQEAKCLNKLSEVVPNMRDSDVTVLAEKVHGDGLLKCIHDMFHRIGKPRNFQVALVSGERLLTLYLKNQVGSDIATIPDLCTYSEVGKMKLHEVLRCHKYKTKLSTGVKKPPRHMTPVPVKEAKKT